MRREIALGFNVSEFFPSPSVDCDVSMPTWRLWERLRFVVDTGSTRTILNQLVWARLRQIWSGNPPNMRWTRVRTPGGTIRVPTGPFALITIFGHRGEPLPIRVKLDEIWVGPNAERCCLGMDALQGLKMAYMGPNCPYSNPSGQPRGTLG